MQAQDLEKEDNGSQVQEQSESDSCLQRQAFPLDQMNLQECNQEEKQAFTYLFGVRNQANRLKQKNRVRQPKIAYQCNLLQKKNEQKKQQTWFSLWKQETINNWKCIRQNCKFLLKNTEQTAQAASKTIKLEQIPNINEIVWIPLGRIQQIMKKISEEYYYSKKGRYYLWMYSLLAVHQAKASYKYFQVLADICGCCDSEQTINQQILIVITILEVYFMQKHLKDKCIPCFSC